MEIFSFFLPFGIACFITAITVPFTIKWAKRFGLADDPKIHKHPAIIHIKTIPRAGGIPLFLGVLAASILFLPLTKLTITLFIASLLTLIIGTLDDKYDISPYVRFSINIICGLVVIFGGVGIPFITNPFGGILHLDALRLSFDFLGHHSIVVFSDLLSLLWIVWVMNMLNWSKGVDGQMPGIVAISSIVIGLLSLRFPLTDPSTHIAATLSFIIAGSAIGFLFYNFYPAKIFPGYGATFLYLLLSVVSVLSTAKLATAILVMGIPMIDGVFTILRRVLSGRSPFWHDKKHLHHLLLRLGLSQRQIALFYWILSAILGAASLTLSSRGKLFAIIMLLVLVGGGLLFLHITLAQKDEKNSI